MSLAANIGYGTVKGKFLDSTGAALTGKITLTPQFSSARNSTATIPETILPKAITVSLPDEPATGVMPDTILVADDPQLGLEPGWTYKVSFAFTGSGAPKYNGFDFHLAESAIVDLTVVAPVSTSAGVQIQQGPQGEPGLIQSVVAGTNVTVDATDPANPIVSASGGGGGTGTVDSVNDVGPDVNGNIALDADAIPDGTANVIMSTAERTKLGLVADGATANSSDATLLERANHTGTQAQSTVTNLTTDLAAKQPLGDYPTNTELTAGLSTKSELGHGHITGDVSGLDTAIAKAQGNVVMIWGDVARVHPVDGSPLSTGQAVIWVASSAPAAFVSDVDVLFNVGA